MLDSNGNSPLGRQPPSRGANISAALGLLLQQLCHAELTHSIQYSLSTVAIRSRVELGRVRACWVSAKKFLINHMFRLKHMERVFGRYISAMPFRLLCIGRQQSLHMLPTCCARRPVPSYCKQSRQTSNTCMPRGQIVDKGEIR